MLWELLFLMTDPRLGNLTQGSELSILWENLCGKIIFQFVVCHLAGMWFDYIAKVTIFLSYLMYHIFGYRIYGCRISFLDVPVFFLLMVVQQLVVILMFPWAELSSSPSTPPSCILSPPSSNALIWQLCHGFSTWAAHRNHMERFSVLQCWCPGYSQAQ